MSASDRLQQATEWFVEWEAAGEIPLSREQLQAWRAWAEDAENLAAFDRIVRVREDARGIRPAVLPVVPRPEPRRRYRQSAFATAAGVAVIAMATVVVYSVQPPRYSTGRAEQRTIRMPDGSSVTLGGQTVLTMEYTAHGRKVVLKSGEALFDVAHEPSRPFIVSAGDAAIRALGTAFVVKRDSDRVVVTVTDGKVEVASHSDTSTRKQLIRGEQISYGEAGKLTAVTSIDPQAATAWSQGRLVFDHEPLRYVIQAVNRYSTRQIMLDPAAGELLYSGMVFQDQTDEWIRGLGRIFPVTAVFTDMDEVAVRLHPEP